jgi:hypothetical protein
MNGFPQFLVRQDLFTKEVYSFWTFTFHQNTLSNHQRYNQSSGCWKHVSNLRFCCNRSLSARGSIIAILTARVSSVLIFLKITGHLLWPFQKCCSPFALYSPTVIQVCMDLNRRYFSLVLKNLLANRFFLKCDQLWRLTFVWILYSGSIGGQHRDAVFAESRGTWPGGPIVDEALRHVTPHCLLPCRPFLCRRRLLLLLGLFTFISLSSLWKQQPLHPHSDHRLTSSLLFLSRNNFLFHTLRLPLTYFFFDFACPISSSTYPTTWTH